MTFNATPRQIVVLVAAVLVGGGSFIGMRVGDGAPSQVATEAAAELDAHLALPAASDADLVALAQPVASTTQAAPAATTKPRSTHQHPTGEGQVQHNHDGDMVHNYVDHVTTVLGANMLAPGQEAYGGWKRVSDTVIQAQSPITALRPAIEQAIADVKKNNPKATGAELESKIAQQLTNYNDWDNLNRETKGKMMILSGINIEAMTDGQREDKVNHLIHSPLPFGDLDEVLTPNQTIDVGYTHTLDTNWTKVSSLGKGVFRVWLVSNNNNGSHTDHSLGSFKVQLPAGTTNDQARKIANDMIVYKNDNNRLLLDPAAKKILYGQTPPLDYSKPIPVTTTTAAPAPTVTTAAPAPTTTAPPPTTPAPTTATTAATSTSTTAVSTTTTAKQ